MVDVTAAWLQTVEVDESGRPSDTLILYLKLSVRLALLPRNLGVC